MVTSETGEEMKVGIEKKEENFMERKQLQESPDAIVKKVKESSNDRSKEFSLLPKGTNFKTFDSTQLNPVPNTKHSFPRLNLH